MPQQYVAQWTGGRIGTGASVFHFESIGSGTAAQSLANAVRTCLQAVSGLFPTDVTIDFDSEVRELANDGTLIDVYPVTTPLQVIGTGAGTYANGVGVLVRHNTAVIAGGRRLLGRTFLVPVQGSAFANTGDVNGSTVTTVNNAFAALRTSAAGTGADLAVWSRANTLTAPVTNSVCLGRPSTLRTRNDRL